MFKSKNTRKLTVLGLSVVLLILVFFNSGKSIAESKFVRIITDSDGIINFLDFNSIKNQGQEKSYTTARVVSKPAMNDNSIPLRRPYNGQRCACPYDYAINGSICGERSSSKTTCFAPTKTQALIISNSVNCKTKIRSIYNINFLDANNKAITSYTAQDITGGAYPVDVEVSDPVELSIINAVCRKK
ncbi:MULTISPECIES: hypothetical protein [Nostoc]|uniref:Uncharacterized protein n=1 Tax=Nostoc paludosum FACHB-159 TaxID=2692908 RepID=A0ABR8KJP9_9NOSO|nr:MULTISPECIES: hypothetical protein [Nostoc]MBD2682643.1 hypothetical protein [Nostoc sp. FACHB-857]MBD2738976.1 hypothetical protein [Nostoc paludosum FACHB-159]